MAKFFAVVPAAGRSVRMKQPKLLLPWNGRTVMDQILSVWTSSCIEHVAVVVRRDDAKLQAVVQKWPVHVVCPETDPADMKASVLAGLQFLANRFAPGERDGCLIAPADLPRMNLSVIQRIAAAHDGQRVVVPCFGERSGHPVLLPWWKTNELARLSESEGINRLLDSGDPVHLSFAADEYFSDIDTPADYNAALDAFDESDRRK